MQDRSLYLEKAKLMQNICKRGPQSSEIFGQKFQYIYHLGKFALVKILEGTLVIAMRRKPNYYSLYPLRLCSLRLLIADFY